MWWTLSNPQQSPSHQSNPAPRHISSLVGCSSAHRSYSNLRFIPSPCFSGKAHPPSRQHSFPQKTFPVKLQSCSSLWAKFWESCTSPSPNFLSFTNYSVSTQQPSSHLCFPNRLHNDREGVIDSFFITNSTRFLLNYEGNYALLTIVISKIINIPIIEFFICFFSMYIFIKEDWLWIFEFNQVIGLLVYEGVFDWYLCLKKLIIDFSKVLVILFVK